jgi:oligopeptide transport system permease protein
MRDFNFVDSSKKLDKEQIRESLTYWKDVWRRLKGNVVAMIGLVGVFLVIIFGVFGPFFTDYTYYEQHTDFAYLPSNYDVYRLSDEYNLFINKNYNLYLIDNEGNFIERLPQIISMDDTTNKNYYYTYGDEIIQVNFWNKVYEPELEKDYVFTYKGTSFDEVTDHFWNKTYLLGSDRVGRDTLTRLMYGARISLTVAFSAAIVNLLIGVTYGSISGFVGGTADNIMMRIVDIINSIPLVIYVILLMVWLSALQDEEGFEWLKNTSGMLPMIFALGTVYWVGMARLVRGQILSLKDQEFVLAAKVIGVENSRIISRHLIPNAIGPILVSLTMMIPTAIFTEAFLSFIGIGMNAPHASWGTMADEAVQLIETYPEQLLLPSIAIGFTVLSFNFLGDGLRTALDPRLRKG